MAATGMVVLSQGSRRGDNSTVLSLPPGEGATGEITAARIYDRHKANEVARARELRRAHKATSSLECPIDLADRQGRTSLMTAANYGQLATVKALVKGGASLNLKDKNGRTAIVYAAAQGWISIVDFLLGSHAGLTSKVPRRATAAEFPDQPARTRHDVLLAAVRHGRLELVRFLLDRGRVDFKLDDEFLLDLQELCGGKAPLISRKEASIDYVYIERNALQCRALRKMRSALRFPPNLYPCLYLCDQVQHRLELVFDICTGGGAKPDEPTEGDTDESLCAAVVAAQQAWAEQQPAPPKPTDCAASTKKKKKNKKKKKKPKADTASGRVEAAFPDPEVAFPLFPGPDEIPSPSDDEGLEAAAAALAKGARAVSRNLEAAATRHTTSVKVDDLRVASLLRLSPTVSPGYVLNVICDHVTKDLPSDAIFTATHNQRVLERLHPIHAECDNLCKILAAKFCMMALPELDDILTNTGEATGVVRGLKELVTCSQLFTIDLTTTFCFARASYCNPMHIGSLEGKPKLMRSTEYLLHETATFRCDELPEDLTFNDYAVVASLALRDLLRKKGPRGAAGENEVLVQAKPHDPMEIAVRLGNHLRTHPETKSETAAKLPSDSFIRDAIMQIYADVAEGYRLETLKRPDMIMPEAAAVIGLFRTVTSAMDPAIIQQGRRGDQQGRLDAPRAIFYPTRPKSEGDPNCSAFAQGILKITAYGRFVEHLRTAYEMGWLPVVEVVILHVRWVLIWMGEPRPDPDPETQDPLWIAYCRIATDMIDHAGPSFSDVDLKVIRMSTESMTPEEADNFGLKAAMAQEKHKRALDAEQAEAEQKEADAAKYHDLNQQRLQLQRLEDAMAQSKKQAGLGEAEAKQFRALDQQLQKLRLQLQQLEGAMALQDMKQPESEAEAEQFRALKQQLLKLSNLEEAINMNNKTLVPTKKRKKKKKGKKADPASSGVEQQPEPEPELDAATLGGEQPDARVVGLPDWGPLSTDEEEDIVLATGGPAHAAGSDDEAALDMQTSVLEATMPQAAAPIDFSQLQPLEDVSWTSSEDDEPEPAPDPGLEAVAAEAAESTAAVDADAAAAVPASDASQVAGVDRRTSLEEITRIEGVIKDNENNITVLASLVGNKTDGDMYDTLMLCRQNRSKLEEALETAKLLLERDSGGGDDSGDDSGDATDYDDCDDGQPAPRVFEQNDFKLFRAIAKAEAALAAANGPPPPVAPRPGLSWMTRTCTTLIDGGGGDVCEIDITEFTFGAIEVEATQRVPAVLACLGKMCQIKHENVLGILGVSSCPQWQLVWPSLISPLGRTADSIVRPLQEFLPGGKGFPQDTLDGLRLPCLRQVAAGLKHLHDDIGIVHAGLSSDAILLVWPGGGGSKKSTLAAAMAAGEARFVISDSGVGAVQLRTGMVPMSADRFSAPELHQERERRLVAAAGPASAAGERGHTLGTGNDPIYPVAFAADWYSYGVLIYEVLAERPEHRPFWGMPTAAIARLVCARFSPDPELLGMVDEATQRWAWDEGNQLQDRRPQLGKHRSRTFGAAAGSLTRMAARCWDDNPGKRDDVAAVLDTLAAYDGPDSKIVAAEIETLTTEQHKRQWLPEGTGPAATKAAGAGGPGGGASKKPKKKKKR